MTNFSSNVKYAPELQDTSSWYGLVEAAADVCKAPGQWVAAELWSGGKKYVITQCDSEGFEIEENNPNITQGIQKASRVIVGLLLCAPGEILAFGLMKIAFNSEEIRLKHRVVSQPLTAEEQQKLTDLIKDRQTQAQERQGCEPISCLLMSICCLLCCLMCSSNRHNHHHHP